MMTNEKSSRGKTMEKAQDNFTSEFNRLAELGSSTFVLRGSALIVEILPDEEIKTRGGIVIATDSRHTGGNSVEAHKLKVGRVLMSGLGYWDEEKKDYIPLDVKPGAVVILPQYSTQFISTFPGIQRPTGNRLAIIKESDLLAYYPSDDAFQTAKAKLNE
jgi:co-chaperonin GroES (HSP10)